MKAKCFSFHSCQFASAKHRKPLFSSSSALPQRVDFRDPVRSLFYTRPVLTKASTQMSQALSFLSFDISQSISSPCVPIHAIKKFQDKTITVRGFVAEVKQAENQNSEQYSNSHSTFFLKVGRGFI